VIVGKRALPSVFVDTDDVVADLRVLVRPGDVVLAVAAAGEPGVAAAMRRGPAWGATTVWVGAGARPDVAAADHVLWVDDGTGLAPWSGRFVLFYHLLWELTHVCFEHPGLLKESPACTEAGCVTCGDEGRLGEVLTATADGMATVRTANGIETVATMLVDPIEAGELVLVHAGTAISRI